MNSESNKSLSSNLKDAVELVPKLLASLAGFFYLIGFLIIQLYLWAYGYVSFELLNVQYLLVGIMALVLPGGILLFFLFYATNYAKPYRGGGTLITLIVITVGFFLSLFVSPMLSGGHPEFRNSNLIIGFSGFFLLFGPAIWGWIYSRYFPATPSTRSFLFVMIVSLSILGIVPYSFSYAIYKYRYVQPFLGGGAPRYVQLVLDSSAAPGFTDAGVEVSTDTKISDVVKLIYVSKDEYLLEPCTSYFDNAIIIRKELVKAVRTGRTCATLSPPEEMPIRPILP